MLSTNTASIQMPTYMLHRWLGVLWLLLVLTPAYAQPQNVGGHAGVDTPTMRKLWDDLHQRDTDLEKANPQQAIEHYTQFLNETAHTDSYVAILVVHAIAHLYAYNLKDTDKAVALCEAGMKQYGDDPRLLLLNEAGHALWDAQRGGEALQLFKQHTDQIFQAYASGAQAVLHPYAQALQQADKNDELIDLLTHAIIIYPETTDPAPNWEWLYQDLTAALLKQRRQDEALSWARLRFAVADCHDESLLNTGRTLATVLNAADPSGQAPVAFAVALRDPARLNPLKTIKMPTFNSKWTAELVAHGVNPNNHRERIHLDIITGHLGAAMQEAVAMLVSHQNTPAAVYEVCRVLKAADLNLIRASEFLNFFKTGEGDSPLEAFFQEYPLDAGTTVETNQPAAHAKGANGTGGGTASGQLSKALLTQLVTIMNMAGQNSPELKATNGSFPAAYVLWSQLHAGQLSLAKAWQAHTLTADDLLAILSLQSGWIPAEDGKVYANFLVTHAPAQVQNPVELGTGPKLWLADYYRSRDDARAVDYFEPLVAASGSTFPELKAADSYLTRQLNEVGERHCDWYYGEQRTKDAICVPRVLQVVLAKGQRPATPLRLRLVIFANQPELIVTCDNSKITLRLEADWRTDPTWYYKHRDVLVELAPSALVPNFQTIVVVESPGAPNPLVRVPLRVVENVTGK